MGESSGVGLMSKHLNGDSLGSSAPLMFASPNSKQKLLLLERRLTGSHTGPHLQPTGGSRDTMPEDGAARTAAQEQPCSQQNSDMDVDACPAAQQQQQHEPPTATPVVKATNSGGTSAADAAAAAAAAAQPPASASKRRKTGKPQFRPATTDSTPAAAAAAAAGHSDTGGKAAGGQAGGGTRDTAQRDKGPKRAKASPPPPAARGEGRAADGTGASNPPMSPVGTAAGTDRGVPGRTPRSSSKQQQQQQHSKGQTNISKFFPLLLDGSSRDSDTPSAIPHQLHQQQQQQQQQQHQALLHMSPIEGLIEPAAAAAAAAWQDAAGSTPALAAATAAAGQAKSGQQPQQHRGGGGGGTGSGSSKGTGTGGGSGSGSSQPAAGTAALQQQLLALQQKRQQEVAQLKEAARRREAQLSESLSSQQRQVEALTGLLGQLQQELGATRSSAEEREAAVRSAVAGLVEALGLSQGQLGRLSLVLDGSRLGSLGVSRAGPLGLTEVWEDGPVFRELAGRQAALRAAREEVEAARKALKRRLAPPPRATAAAAAADAAGDAGGSQQQQQQYISSAEYVMQDEILKVRLSVLRREEEVLSREDERLQAEKMRHLRSLKRLRDEEASRFSGQPTLARRYVLLALLGRGGFSEVHKAYDLATLKFVAVKLHQLNSGWSEGRKASYVRHAVREYTIHKALRHDNIVSLTDIFEVDNTTFATVLELCEGGDLEGYLQQHTVVPEREARALIAQVFAGLAYLNRGGSSSSSDVGGLADDPAAAAAGGAGGTDVAGPRVIHYDLKPANILFDRLGRVKITDFGLSKVVEEGQTMGMELTSQGAGTYWYLPPECFQTPGSSSAAAAAAAAVAVARSRGAAASAGVGGLLPPGLLSGGGGGGAGAGGGAAAAAAWVVPAGPPKISNKVDVWSAGVILYQMLYGRRPFGEGLSQEQIYRDGVMLNARQVQFPAKPAVSAEGRAFLSRCLAYDQADRWDVLTAAADPYLQLKR